MSWFELQWDGEFLTILVSLKQINICLPLKSLHQAWERKFKVYLLWILPLVDPAVLHYRLVLVSCLFLVFLSFFQSVLELERHLSFYINYAAKNHKIQGRTIRMWHSLLFTLQTKHQWRGFEARKPWRVNIIGDTILTGNESSERVWDKHLCFGGLRMVVNFCSNRPIFIFQFHFFGENN